MCYKIENENSVPEDHSSLQSLAALLNITSEAEIGPEGPKFKLNKKAVNLDLAKQMIDKLENLK